MFFLMRAIAAMTGVIAMRCRRLFQLSFLYFSRQNAYASIFAAFVHTSLPLPDDQRLSFSMPPMPMNTRRMAFSSFHHFRH